MNIIDEIKGKVIVSSQAMPNEPFYKEDCMKAMIESVVNGGAGGLRVAGVRDVKIAKNYNIPVIGITKPDKLPTNWMDVVYITPTLRDVSSLINAGADIIAFDGTTRPRPDGSSLKEVINLIRNLNRISMADISLYEEGMYCADIGVDIVSTTLSGYTKQSENNESAPDFNLLSRLVKELKIPVILEGKIWTPDDVKKAFDIGAHSVVIGSAITRPHLITKRFVNFKG